MTETTTAAITRDELPQCVGMIFDAAGNAIESFDWTPEALDDAARRLRRMLGEQTTVTYEPSPFIGGSGG